MKEALMLLPRANGFGRGELVNQMVRESSNHNRAKKRYASNDHLEEVTRTSKSMMMIKEPEDICGHEMWDDIMSHGYETYIIRGMEKPRIAMANEVEKNSRKDSRKAVVNVVDIHTILILCAQAVAANDHMRAGELLKQIKHGEQGLAAAHGRAPLNCRVPQGTQPLHGRLQLQQGGGPFFHNDHLAGHGG
jgi:hypothetical protein